jgi:hypothetical protein
MEVTTASVVCNSSSREAFPMSAGGSRKKLVEIDDETWQALVLLARDTASDFQELCDEAFRDLLKNYRRPSTLKEALRRSVGTVAKKSTLPR